MAELTGLRLVILDELMRLGAMNLATLSRHMKAPADLADAIAWLARHRLIVGEEGQWRAVHPRFARVQVEMNGLLSQQAVGAGLDAREEQPRPAVPVVRGRTAAVQRHQVEIFTLEGYRDSNGSRD